MKCPYCDDGKLEENREYDPILDEDLVILVCDGCGVEEPVLD